MKGHVELVAMRVCAAGLPELPGGAVTLMASVAITNVSLPSGGLWTARVQFLEPLLAGAVVDAACAVRLYGQQAVLRWAPRIRFERFTVSQL